MTANPPTEHIICYPSLTQWWADRLAGAIATCAPQPRDAIQGMALPPFSGNVQRWNVLASPLPLRLARIWGRSPQEIGAQLIKALTDSAPNPALQPDCWMHGAGWLYAQFSGTALSTWLQTWISFPPRSAQMDALAITQGMSSSPTLFLAQYAHARGCSLLRLAQQERLIRLREADNPISDWIWPDPVPWRSLLDRLDVPTAAEPQLLNALMQFPQSLWGQKNIQGYADAMPLGYRTHLTGALSQAMVQRSAQRWSELFLSFDSQCRMFGNPATLPLEMAQSRLGVVFLTRRILAYLLQTLLHIDAPLDL